MLQELLLLLLIFEFVYSQEELLNPDCNHWFEPGECNDFTVKWYYDRYDHRCRKFYYSGCGGNANKYNSLEECSASCTYTPPSAADRCSLPHEPGHCNSDIERWFFDWQKKQCVCSYWTGCGGNSNRFYSYNHCMEICGEFSHPWIGPGIDEKYWGVLNKSTMSPENAAVFVNKPAFVYPPDAWWNPANAPGGAVKSPETNYAPPVPPAVPDYHSQFAQPAPDVTIQDNDYFNDYREMTASETNHIPIVARGSKTVTMERPIVEAPNLPRRTKKIKKNKVPPRRINQIIVEDVTTPAPQLPQTTFSYTYYTDFRGNQVSAPRETLPPARSYQQSYQQRLAQFRPQSQNSQNVAGVSTPMPTQFYVTYKTDAYGRQIWNQKIWWTGDGPMPIQALRARYPYWLPPPYDGFGKNPYDDYDQNQNNRRWYTSTAIPTTPQLPTMQTTPPIVRVPSTSPPTTMTTPTTTTTTTQPPTTSPPPTIPVVTTTQLVYSPPPPQNIWTTPPPIVQPTYPVQTTIPSWVRKYPTTTQPPPVYPTRPWWTYTTTPFPTRPQRPPTPEPTLRQFVRQPPSYTSAIDRTPNHFERPLIQDMSTRPSFTTSRPFIPARTATAEPIQFQRWLVQRITTEKPELSIDDIIALDEETYDDYDMQMEPDTQEHDAYQAAATLPPRIQPVPPAPIQRRVPPSAHPPQRNDGWQPIVMPPPSSNRGGPTRDSDYANSVDFDIQSHGDT